VSQSAPTADREIILSRVFDAPRALVYRAFTDPAHVARWWGPNGCTTTIHEMDVRPGGVWRYVMHAPNGVDYDNLSRFHEVVEPERLAYNLSSGDPNDPGFEVIVTFEEEGDRTRLTLRQLHATPESRDYVIREYNAVELGNQSLNRLAEYLTSLPAELA
jgi:uncharacterized protein YndB with AHSA1/START domain